MFSWVFTIMDEVFTSSKNVELLFGTKKAIELRIRGWEEVKKENLVIVASETTPKKKIKIAEMKRGKAVAKRKIETKFIENISDMISLEKNMKRLEQGIEVRYFPHHGFSVSIRDRETVLLEFPMPDDELLNIKIKDKEFAKQMVNYFYEMWKKAKPLDKKLIEELKCKFQT